MRACPTPQYKPHHPRHRLAVTGSSLADKLSTYKAYAALDLDDRRTLISTMLSVVVNPGRGAGRVAITPRNVGKDAPSGTWLSAYVLLSMPTTACEPPR